MDSFIVTLSGNPALIEPEELAVMLARPESRIRLLDATYGADARRHYERGRIGPAVFFDIDAIADRASPLPHMLPDAAGFAAAVGALGISNDDTVIVYDQGGMAMAAARAWWMFRVFGHDNVRVLNGGLPGWTAARQKINDAPPAAPKPGHFTARFRPELVRGLADVQAAVTTKNALILDARSAARFAGHAPEPRPGLRAGHIPGSVNVPYADLLDEKQKMKPLNVLEDFFKSAREDMPVIASCGSGVTACVLALGLYGLGRRDVAVYDGSWAEWGDEKSGTAIEQ